MSLPDRTRQALERAAAAAERRGKPPASPPTKKKEEDTIASSPPADPAPAPPLEPVTAPTVLPVQTTEAAAPVKKEGESGLFAVGEVVMAVWAEDGLWYR
jgi:hypothetical protein